MVESWSHFQNVKKNQILMQKNTPVLDLGAYFKGVVFIGDQLTAWEAKEVQSIFLVTFTKTSWHIGCFNPFIVQDVVEHSQE